MSVTVDLDAPEFRIVKYQGIDKYQGIPDAVARLSELFQPGALSFPR